MSATAESEPARGAAPGRPRSLLRQVALPAEHGGWSLTAEPIVLGLLVAWSGPGLALGAAAMVAFLARTPLKLVLVDLRRGRRLERTRLAARVAAIETAVIVVLAVAAAAGSSTGRFWVPIAVAAPLVVLELWFDMRSRGRRLVPELAGTVGIGSVATAIALVDGADASLAVGLWCVAAARAAAAIPHVRTQLQRAHGRTFHRWHSDVAQLVALAVVATASMVDAIPVAPVATLTVVAVFDLCAVRMAPRPAVIIGIQQTVIGVVVVAATAIAVTH